MFRRKGNLSDFDQWRHVRAPVMSQHDACDHHMHAGLQRNFEILEFKFAVKPESRRYASVSLRIIPRISRASRTEKQTPLKPILLPPLQESTTHA